MGRTSDSDTGQRRGSTVSAVTLSSILSEVEKRTRTNWKCFGFTIKKRFVFGVAVLVGLVGSLAPSFYVAERKYCLRDCGVSSECRIGLFHQF